MLNLDIVKIGIGHTRNHPCVTSVCRKSPEMLGFFVVLVPLGVEINPPVQPGVRKDFSKAETGELKASPKGLKENQTSKYNSSGLAAALLKYKEV